MCHLSTIKVKYVITADGITQITVIRTKKDNPAILTPLVVALTNVLHFPKKLLGSFLRLNPKSPPIPSKTYSGVQSRSLADAFLFVM